MHDEENLRYVTKKGCIDLTLLESLILKILIDNKRTTVTYKQFEKLGFYQETSDLRCIIHRLRKKLKGELEIKCKAKIGYYIN